MVTVAVRRVNILDKRKPILMDYLSPKIFFIYQIQQDVLILKRGVKNFTISKRNGGWNIVKLEVLGDKKRFTQI